MRTSWLLLSVLGCGRLNFDSCPDVRSCATATGHDEDLDCIDDGCDGCPHLADPEQLDFDGDGVNDICDPRQRVPGEHIAFFDPFVARRPEWEFAASSPGYVGDSLDIDTRGNGLVARLVRPPGNDYFEMAGTIGLGTMLDAQITLYVAGAGPGKYYCEVVDFGNGQVHFDVAYTQDGSSYGTGDVQSMKSPLAEGRFMLAMNHAPPVMTCMTSWPPGGVTTESIPAGIPANVVGLFAHGFVLQLDYFLQIHSD